MTAPVPMACKVCRHPLTTRVHHGSTLRTWVHPAGVAVDHDPVPTPADTLSDVHYRCDFCGDNVVAFVYSTTADTTYVVASRRVYDRTRREQIGHRSWVQRPLAAPAVDIAAQRSLGAWLACTPCAELIELRDCERLITRFRRQHPELRVTRKHLRSTFIGFFRVIGPRMPFGNQHMRP